ncbi:MAG TPA: DUF1080 domain-containing protein [Povalibacter sp.]
MRTLPGALLALLVTCALPAQATEPAWHNLLDKDFAQWDVYLSYSGDTIASVVTGKAPPSLRPIGLNKDTKHVFSVLDDHGTPVLRVSGEIYGSSATKLEYSNYHFRARFKWGEKKWNPRLTELKDSGLVYHSTGEFGVDYWHSWMQGQEFQVIEGGIGDYWTIARAQIDIRAARSDGSQTYRFYSKAPWLKFAADSEAYGAVGNYCATGEDTEIKGDWNQIELLCYEDRCVHIANGKVVMALKNSRHVVDNKVVPLTRGKLQIQSEAAEVFYKDIEIRSIDVMPAQYDAYFR